jgi:hypothetical protein
VFIMETPPSYGSGAPYGVTPGIDGWIKGDVPSQSLELRHNNLMREAKCQISNAAPTWTAKALENAFHSGTCNDRFGLTEMTRASGFISLPFGIIGDIIKAPVYIVLATITVTRSALGSTSAREKVENEAMGKIIASFSQRFEATLMILIRMGIETPQSLHCQFQNGNLDHFLTLTLFFTAFASRLAKDGSICLASGKTLSRNHCPAIGLQLFDYIHSLKTDLIFAELPSTIHEAAAIVEEWLPTIIQILKVPDSIIDNSTPHLERLLKTLRQIQREVNDLPINESEIRNFKAVPVTLAQRRV